MTQNFPLKLYEQHLVHAVDYHFQLISQNVTQKSHW